MAKSFKRSIDFYFNLSLIICYILFGILLLSSCSFTDSSEVGKKSKNAECDVEATVRDFALDGCGMVLVLENGEKLMPFIFCATPPLSDVDDFILHKLKDGMKVKLSYNETDLPNVCMAGKTVTISCITEVR